MASCGRSKHFAMLMQGLKKLLYVLSTGYILMFYSELVFWARYRPGEDSAIGFVTTWLVYSFVGFVFLSVVAIFHVRSIWALFLCGALYGWLIEGVVVQTMYEALPFQISWTGLAWHALITVLVGWYGVREALLKNRQLKTGRLAALIGLFWGFWAVCWWVEEPGTSPSVPGFAWFAFLSSSLVMMSYWLCDKLSGDSFSVKRWQVYLAGILLVLYFVFVSLPAAPIAGLLLPPLLGVILLSLRRNMRMETRSGLLRSSAGPVKAHNYLCLCVVPVVAVAVYAILWALGVKAHTNWFVAIVTTPTGAILFVVSVIRIWKAKPHGAAVLAEQDLSA